MKISIIVPAYNEEKRIGFMLESYSSFFKKIKGLKYEIIVVINNTQDNTEEIVKKFKKKDKNIQYLNKKKGGKGYAIIEGFKYALKGKIDIVGFVDADGAISAPEALKLSKKCLDADLVIASRHMKGAKIIPSDNLSRRVSSKLLNIYINSLFGWNFKDTQCGAKFFRKDSLNQILKYIKNNGWAIDIDLINESYKHKYKIIEVPIVWEKKPGSKVRLFRTGGDLFFNILKIRIK